MNDILNNKVHYQDLHEVEYLEAWKVQEKLLNSILHNKILNKQLPINKQIIISNHLLFVSHPHVYTLGKNGKKEHLLVTEDKLNEMDAAFVITNRGGDITYHGPGQLVGYPILDLENFFTDIHKYMRYLEEVIIKTLANYGIKGERSAGETGVWLDPGTSFARKICAMGVKASRWVTMHGFALNINTDLRYFDFIVPCGIRNKSVTSLQKELKREVDIEDVKIHVKNNFEEIFNIEWV